MGYQVGVTPLQMVAAVSSVANGGNYIEPRVVRAVYRDGRASSCGRRCCAGRQHRHAAALTGIMEQVVERGTATLAQIPGYTIAGKTGTANKLVNGRYSNDTYASFVGFLPSRDPAVAILVVLDSPRGNNGHFGGPVSAPIFRRIAEDDAALPAACRRRSIPTPPVLVAPGHRTSRRCRRAPTRPSRRCRSSRRSRERARCAGPERARRDAQADQVRADARG